MRKIWNLTIEVLISKFAYSAALRYIERKDEGLTYGEIKWCVICATMLGAGTVKMYSLKGMAGYVIP